MMPRIFAHNAPGRDGTGFFEDLGKYLGTRGLQIDCCGGTDQIKEEIQALRRQPQSSLLAFIHPNVEESWLAIIEKEAKQDTPVPVYMVLISNDHDGYEAHNCPGNSNYNPNVRRIMRTCDERQMQAIARLIEQLPEVNLDLLKPQLVPNVQEDAQDWLLSSLFMLSYGDYNWSGLQPYYQEYLTTSFGEGFAKLETEEQILKIRAMLEEYQILHNIPPTELDCDFSPVIVRGTLLHAWLENSVLDIHTSRAGIQCLQNGDRWEALEEQFLPSVKQAIRLAENLVNYYSPRQLVDRFLPCLPEEEKERLGAALHNRYCETCNVEELAQHLNASAVAAQESLQAFLKYLSKGADRGKVLSYWKSFHKKAEQLYEVLKKVPKGVVIP